MNLVNCKCEGVDFGTYENAVTVEVPAFMRGLMYGCYHVPETVDIDECILPQIQELWMHNIITTGCCCGHGKIPSTVTVAPESEVQMEVLGFARWDDHPHVFLLGDEP